MVNTMGERGASETGGETDGDGTSADDVASTDDAYVHRPSGEPPRKAEATDDEFGWRGWVLVGVLVFSFLLVPWALILLPTAQSGVSALGLSWRDTYLAVPMLPALLLGAVGVWTALHARRG